LDVEQTVSTAEDVVLAVNNGSSSLKYAIFAVGENGERQLASGAANADSIGAVLERLSSAKTPPPTLIGHRVVHGGARHVAPARIDASVLSELKDLVPLAPLHLPASIAGIEALTLRYPNLPQVACFDTAFHASMPEVARRLPIPERFDREGVRRYGFHGLSFEWTLSTFERIPRRLVIAHLGSGSSLVAVKDGKSIDTTMGLTPAGGIPMATRSGDLDPGVVFHLLREKHLGVDELERLIVHESGLAAVGGTSDVKTLLERAPTDERAALAVSMFCYAVRKAVGAFAAALGGLDALVFTGGIGENSSQIRAHACNGLEPFGLRLDIVRNERGTGVVSADGSPCEVRVIAANEDLMIARHTRRVVRGSA
jgi:acetate kinase